MSLKVLLFVAAVAGYASAEFPSYIHVCGLRNPNLDQCIIDSVNSIADTIRVGDPELGIPSAEPFLMDRVNLADLPNFKAYGTNIKIYGLPTYHINSLHVDPEKHQFDVDLTFREIRMEADYNVTARILIPIVATGPIHLVIKDVGAKTQILYELVDHKGKKHMYFSSMTTNLDIKDFDAKFESRNFDKTVQQAVGQALGGSHKEIIETCKPAIESAISKKCLDLANNICKNFTYEELFPDRE
ncbi:uncharacterized protein LOC117224537 [Megalopta genalis]|uniref:uncharacterized protein LOC117224537 n=1 Tax=Megalopta genalis TaxID=115081 RepID=UPI003FD21F68